MRTYVGNAERTMPPPPCDQPVMSFCMQHGRPRCLCEFSCKFIIAPKNILSCFVSGGLKKKAAGLWERALEVAEANDRINLSTTHQLYAQHLEKVRVRPTHTGCVGVNYRVKRFHT